MDAEIASHVYPIINQGLALRDRLRAGEMLDVDLEQTTLKRLLTASSGLGAPRNVRYAVVCWLDELLGNAPGWGPVPWEEQTLEMDLHGTSDGMWRFWDLARQAEQRGTCDALEVHYLLVMLGFRGELAEEPEQLGNWVEATRRRIETNGGVDWLQPPDLEPVTHVPPLTARDRLQSTVLLAGLAFLVLIPAAVLVLLRQLS